MESWGRWTRRMEDGGEGMRPTTIHDGLGKVDEEEEEEEKEWRRSESPFLAWQTMLQIHHHLWICHYVFLHFVLYTCHTNLTPVTLTLHLSHYPIPTHDQNWSPYVTLWLCNVVWWITLQCIFLCYIFVIIYTKKFQSGTEWSLLLLKFSDHPFWYFLLLYFCIYFGYIYVSFIF